MLNNNGTIQNVWFSKGAQAFSGAVWGGAQNIRHYFSLKKRNDVLAHDNHELRLRIAELESMIADTISLNSNPSSSGIAGGYRYIPATIVKISNNTHHNYIILSKGYADGVVKGSGVITGKGAIGVIDAVGRNHSYARSFKNHEMNISARLGKEGAVGPMTWDGFSSPEGDTSPCGVPSRRHRIYQRLFIYLSSRHSVGNDRSFQDCQRSHL